MGLLKGAASFLVLTFALPGAEALMAIYDPKLCYILDGVLALYGIVITGMFIKEKFFTVKPAIKGEESIYTDLKGQDDGGYAPLRGRDAERGMDRKRNDDVYTPLRGQSEDTYKQLPVQKERRKNAGKVYQDLSSVKDRDTYNTLKMQPLPPR